MLFYHSHKYIGISKNQDPGPYKNWKTGTRDLSWTPGDPRKPENRDPNGTLAEP